MRKQLAWQLVPLVALIIFLGSACATVISAQAPPGPRARAPRYDAAAEVTLKGTVEAVQQSEGRRGWAGTHLTLKTGEETLDVHAGPSWFLAKQKMSFAKGDEIEVTGAKAKFGEQEALLARVIKKGEQSVTLRDARGIPVWARGRRAPR